jgi:hypothetical protein
MAEEPVIRQIGTIQSNAFRQFFLTLDPTGLGPDKGARGGSVSGKNVPQIVNIHIADGKIAIESTAPPTSGGSAHLDSNVKSVFLWRGEGPKFHLLKQPDGTVAFESVPFPGNYLSVDGNGNFSMQPHNRSWEKFIFWVEYR